MEKIEVNAKALRILVVVSRPLAQLVPVEHGGQQFEAVSPVPLEPVEAVRDGLRRVFLDDETPARVRYLPWARLADLQAALAETYEVVHFVGHGAEDGRLLLEADGSAADLVSPQRLAETMREAGMRLALLSACHSGVVGRALHEAGIPNVVMVDERYPMAARAAALFNRQFYAWLARGHRPLEAFEAGIRAVRTDRDFGDEAPPPRNEYTGEIEPRYGERFDKIIADDRPLVDEVPTVGYEELRPSKAVCAVTREEVFIGREAEMIEIIRQMQTARLVTLIGPGGIGKTALARRVALWHAERRLFRNGVIEVNLQNARDEGELASQLAYALNMELDPRRPWDTIRGALAGLWLLLLDNADDLDSGALAHLGEPLLGRLEELHLLVTSRAPLNLLKYEQTVEVEQLPVGRGEWIGPAEWMFIAYTPQRRQVDILCQHLDAMRDICHELGGYPLGILLEAAQLSDERETPEHLLDALRANMVKALRYSRPAGLPDRHKSVGAAMKGSHDKLGAAAKQLLAHIAVFPGGAGEEMLVALEGLDEAQWKGAEREARDVGLVRWVEGRYRMLPPIRAWAQTTLPADELDTYRLRAAHWLAEQAEVWDNSLTPSEERRAYATEMAEEAGQKAEDVERLLTLTALAAFDRERENLLAAVGWAYDARAWELVWRLAGDLVRFFDIRAYWADWEQIHQLALEAVREVGDRHGEGQTLMNLGRVCDWQCRWAEAIEMYKQALEIARELGNRYGEERTLGNLGDVYFQQGRWAEAIKMYKQALEIARELGDRHVESTALNNLSNIYSQQGHWAVAIEMYEASLRIKRELGDRHGEGQTLTNMGLVYANLGRWEEAIGCYETSLRIKRELGDRHGEGQTLTNLGIVYAKQGELDKALETAEKALYIFKELKAYPDLVTCHRLMALFSLRTGDTSACFNNLAQAFSLALQIHPKLAVDTIDRIVGIAKELAGEGRFAETATLGSGLHKLVVEMEKERWRSNELKDSGMLSRRVCAVIALVGKSRLEEVPEEERVGARETALGVAKEVDEATDGIWGLEEWVRETTTD
jgi:tetratricopeptide (TPR) repeat protein